MQFLFNDWECAFKMSGMEMKKMYANFCNLNKKAIPETWGWKFSNPSELCSSIDYPINSQNKRLSLLDIKLALYPILEKHDYEGKDQHSKYSLEYDPRYNAYVATNGYALMAVEAIDDKDKNIYFGEVKHPIRNIWTNATVIGNPFRDNAFKNSLFLFDKAKMSQIHFMAKLKFILENEWK